MPARSPLGIAVALGFVVFSAIAATAGLYKVLVIGWAGFVVMGSGALVSAKTTGLKRTFLPAWGYGLASGAMIVSASVFLVPAAVEHHAAAGGIGIGLGILVGYISHTLGHRLTHADLPIEHTTLEIGAHALAAGSIIGIVYGTMPRLDLLFGLAIVSHKGPAGYAAAERLNRFDKPISAILFPAGAFGSAAILVSLLSVPPVPAINGIIFGFGAGVLLHVAMDFSPRCEVGGEVFEVTPVGADAHNLLDRLRIHVVASMSTGALAVLAAWVLLSGP
ncbi:MAG: ZIP family metal transporter [Halodesulfurarchaeum sp.]